MDTDKKYLDSADKDSDLPLNKMLYPKRSIVRIFLAFLAFIIWIFIGYSPNILLTSSVQGLVGVLSFLVQNPMIFLIIAFINIGMGILFYILIETIFWAGFHLLWSIRWFYGFAKYSRMKNNKSIRG